MGVTRTTHRAVTFLRRLVICAGCERVARAFLGLSGCLPPSPSLPPSAFRGAPTTLQIDLQGQLQRIVDFNAEIANGAFQLAVAEEKLACAKVACFLVEHGDLRST
jgi:hypothetical protein